MGDDAFHQIPAKYGFTTFHSALVVNPLNLSSISTIVDLLEKRNIGWASYQENMPTDGAEDFT